MKTDVGQRYGYRCDHSSLFRKSNIRAETLGDETFSFDELKDMHYIQAALTESLRLYPSVPIDTK